MTVRIINADVMEGLRQLPDESVHCVVTSPPYWGLRDYGVDGQIGLESDLGGFIAKMVEVFAEVRRVLRKDGALWLNFGDSYASSVNGRSAADVKALGNDDRTFRDKPFSTIGPIFRPGNPEKNGGVSNRNGLSVGADTMIKPKDMCGIPWRVAFALQADGWWLRSDIIWAKPNPMPESVTDRPTKSHEYVFLLTKSERYFYDAEAIKEAAVADHASGNGFAGRQGNAAYRPQLGGTGKDGNRRTGGEGSREQWSDVGGSRNKRSVWTIATSPFPEAHFATFPPELPEICIKAGCPVGGTVLDPFSGAGTTALVADRLQRNAIGIELNPTYAAMSEKRINKDRGALLDLMEATP